MPVKTWKISELADSFFGFENRATLVLSALRASAVGELLFLAVRADRQRTRSQKIM
jgi:hypothetical protein